ncbi:MAG: SusD/RagB family nutrient-binding outer membrane lipoprotein [Flavobacteriaceae bacterium]|nr:SusD/RagB family nutrient-binding outer membrane lipoprotein [Flavobacteriaceae bacterium]
MKKIFLITLLISITFSCEDFDGWNVDTRNPSSVPGSYLVTSAQKSLFDQMTSTSVNSNIFKMFAQQWTETQYVDEANYDIRGRDIGGNFSSEIYRDVLNDLQEAAKIISANEFIDAETKANSLAIIEIFSVYAWHVMVDTYGDIPYSQALVGGENLLPVYDDDAAIYTDLFNRLTLAIAMLKDGGSVGGADLIYNGDINQWKKFGYSLLLKMAVRTADFDIARSTKYAGEALGNVFDSNADDASFPYEVNPPNNNPIWGSLVQSGRNDFVLANTFVDLINPLNDPRAPIFMDQNLGEGVYVGATYGAGSSYVSFTHVGDLWHTADFEAVILSFSEVNFLLAEAVERGLISGDAIEYYDAAIYASMAYWGVGLVETASYIAQEDVAYDSSNWKKSIGIQKYLSLYGRGFESWSTWRLLDYPNTMNRPEVSGEAVPRRYLYGNSDVDVNGDNYDAASAAMGGDLKSSRVFWDIKGQGN